VICWGEAGYGAHGPNEKRHLGGEVGKESVNKANVSVKVEKEPLQGKQEERTTL